ncbi:MAG: hypothetical protein COC19_04320 [SAR86 cluster bacterium]|uniref:OmpA-like domain-containing protein n=1 Tax=SAR86 cluster bacterium TaxID=2030880 RepID=A0A2A4MPE4_9GAMM|nr:MAG: hypothetical protein COC19_04320 [SAR86 cluster bacterium]
MMQMKKLTIAVCLLMLSGPSFSQMEVHIYNAPLGVASWELQPSVFECSLSQLIPGYGKVGFYHQAGEELQFRFVADNNVMRVGQVALGSIPPAWKHRVKQRNLGYAQLNDGPTAIVLDAPMAKKLMSELQFGMTPEVVGAADFDAEVEVKIQISPFKFANVFGAYQQCISHLLPINYAQIERSSIAWKVNASSLDADALTVLNNIVLYSNADSRVYAFEIDSFTDTEGERMDNLRVSEQRAFLVRDYLISQGIESTRIATRAHGEREEYLLVANERSRADRNRNRRVNIVVLRE